MNDINVLVTATGCASVGEQILKALRLSTLPLHITASDCDAKSTGAPLADAFQLVPKANHPHYAEMVLDLCRKHKIQALFIGSEAELLALSSARDEFSREGIFLPLQPENVLALCLEKARLYAALNALGIATPWYRHIGSLADLSDNPPYPLVFKPSKQSGGSTDVFIVRNDKELHFFASYLLEQHGEFVAQEYVGTAEDEFTVGVLQDTEGTLMGTIGLHRNLNVSVSRRQRVKNTTDRKELGEHLVISSGISQGTLSAYPQVCEPCAEVALALGGRGPMNIQCRFTNGRLCLLEINPRFSGTTSLRALGGWNEPEMLIRRHLLGQKEIPAPYSRTIYIGRRLEEVIIPEINSEE